MRMEWATSEQKNAMLLAGCARAEELVKAGGYMKWQDGNWCIFLESNGEVAAGPAKSLYELAFILGSDPHQARRVAGEELAR